MDVEDFGGDGNHGMKKAAYMILVIRLMRLVLDSFWTFMECALPERIC